MAEAADGRMIGFALQQPLEIGRDALSRKQQRGFGAQGMEPLERLNAGDDALRLPQITEYAEQSRSVSDADALPGKRAVSQASGPGLISQKCGMIVTLAVSLRQAIAAAPGLCTITPRERSRIRRSMGNSK